MKQKCVHQLMALLAITACTAGIRSAKAAYSEPASFRSPKKIITLGASGYSTGSWNDTWVFQKAINDVAAAGGGKVIVPNGNYRAVNVKLKSNVHLLVKTGAKITLHEKGSVFYMGGGISNTSIRGSGGRFTFEMPNVDQARAVFMADVKNAMVKDVNINDPYKTTFSAFEITWDSTTKGTPIDISLGNITQNHASYGYGVSQLQACTRGSFWNIKSKGGVALRFETDWKTMVFAGDGGVYDCKLNNVTSESGQTAVKLQPHAKNNGDIFMNFVNAIGSEFAISHEKGGTWKYTDAQINQYNLSTGRFGKLSMGNVNAVYRSSGTPISWAKMNYYPESELRKIYKTDSFPYYTGPSGGVILDVGIATSRSTWKLSKTGAFVNPIILKTSYNHPAWKKDRPAR